jgi:hypothetical protein
VPFPQGSVINRPESNPRAITNAAIYSAAARRNLNDSLPVPRRPVMAVMHPSLRGAKRSAPVAVTFAALQTL